MRVLFFLIVVVFSACKAVKTAEPTDINPVLFTVGDSAVFADEFIYVYSKNNARLDSAFTRNDVAEYLDLYIKFKLKVREAYEQRMDTLDSYSQELNTYITQIKQPYLTASRLTDDLVKEAYERLAYEVRASHILIRVDENASDTLAAYEKISALRQQVLDGANFDSLAYIESEDPSAKSNRGDLGYFSSMQMVYPFETAAFTTEPGNVSPVIRTSFGYHILQVKDRQEARGKVVVSHIMLRHRGDSSSVENQIREIYDQLQAGADWNEMVEAFSEDQRTKSQGGKLPAFGTGQLPQDFLNTAFGLTTPGEIGQPVKTPYGWHILRLEERLPVPAFEEIRPTIQQRIRTDGRADIGRKQMVKSLQTEWGFREYPQGLTGLKDSVFTWNADSATLFVLGEKSFDRDDFFSYLSALGRPPARNTDYSSDYNEFVATTVLKWEEAHLEDKFPEYKMLLREYREGLLYFQLMEKEIWLPAGEDSVGLEKYYELNRDKYLSASEAHARVYTLADSSLAEPLARAISDGNDAKLEQLAASYRTEFNRALVPVNISWEENSSSPWAVIPMKNGVYKEVINDKLYIVEVFEIEEGRLIPLDEIRGQVISDYQNSLEEIWVNKLKNKYTVSKNDAGEKYVFEKLVR